MTPHLARLFSSVHAIDTSEGMLKSLHKHLPGDLTNISYSYHTLGPSSEETFRSNAPQRSPTCDDPTRESVPPHASFDIAVTNMVLHHVDDIPSFMDGVKGVVKPRGWFVVTEMGSEENQEGTEDDPHRSKVSTRDRVARAHPVEEAIDFSSAQRTRDSKHCGPLPSVHSQWSQGYSGASGVQRRSE